MLRRSTLAALVAALFVAGAVIVPGPHATRVAIAPDATLDAANARARLLDRHGEPALAWDALRGQDTPLTDAGARLAARLLTELGRFAEAESLVAREAFAADPRLSFLQRLQRARLNYDCGRFAAALELLSANGAPDAALSAYRGLLLARVHLALGNPGEAAACIAVVDPAAVPAALRGPLGEERVRTFRALDQPRDALTAAAAAIQVTGDATARRSLMVERYDLAWECDDSAEAMRAARSLFDAYRSALEAGMVALDLLARNEAVPLPGSILLACGEVLVARGDTAGLKRALRILDGRKLGEREAETHRILWSEYHYESGDYSRAIALARPSYSEPSLRRRSMLVMARSLRKLGNRDEAASMYQQFVRAYPNDPLAAEALYAAASLYRSDGKLAESARVLDQLRRSYPSTFHGWAAAMRRADELSRDKDGSGATAIYEQWLARSRRTDEAALFYLAQERESERAGSGGMILDELRALNPYSFYVAPDVSETVRGPLRVSNGGSLREGPGSLSEWLGRTDAERSVAYQRVLVAATGSRTPADLEADRAVTRGLFFLEAGLRDWAEGELEAARAAGTASAEKHLLLARMYEEYAMPWRSVRLYERARSNLAWEDRRALTADFRFLTHPLPYPAQVLDNAAKNGVPPHLIYGMIREESRFEADVVSRAGAVGLMQLMPQTAREVAAQLDLVADVDDRLAEPAVNVSLGVWYAAELLRDGKGSVAWMLAAYNAGPGAAERWLSPGVSGAAAIEAVESIDYQETRGYVKRVVESANVYHDLYFKDGGARSGPR